MSAVCNASTVDRRHRVLRCFRKPQRNVREKKFENHKKKRISNCKHFNNWKTMSNSEQMSLLAAGGQDFEAGTTLSHSKAKNWPRWPKPLIYHDISADIPGAEQSVVRRAYLSWYLFVIACLWNMVSIMAGIGHGSHVIGIVLCWVYLVALIPAAFVVYLVLYSAARKRSAFRYCLYQCLGMTEACTCIFFAVGLQSTGAGGLVFMINLFSDGEVTIGIFNLFAMLFWGLCGLAHLWISWQARRLHQEAGGAGALKQEASQQATNYAYDNRQVLAEGAVDQLYQSQTANAGLSPKHADDQIASAAYDNSQSIANQSFDADPDSQLMLSSHAEEPQYDPRDVFGN
jgi:SCAMP family